MSPRTVPESQAAPAVLMIRPANFAANPETLASNAFQKTSPGGDLRQQARAEFDALAQSLQAAGVRVEVFEDRTEPVLPDATFPNNWVSFHADGSAWLYPMLAANRRAERRADILESLKSERGYRLERVEDLSAAEREGRYLEGTGSLVLDRPHRVAYACLSPRTDAGLIQEWARRVGYEPVTFHAADAEGRPLYHTNVMLCIGERFAVLCLESIADPAEREQVGKRLRETGHEIVLISLAQMESFAGNMLEIASRQGGTVLALSTRAARSLTSAQRAALSKHARLVSSSIDTIEDCAGGSVRCMLAEIFLPHP